FFRGLPDEGDPGPGNADETDGQDGEGQGSDGLRERPSEDRPDDEAGSEDDRVDAERRARDGPLDDVAEVGERGGRERPGSRGEDRDEGPLGDEEAQVRSGGGRRGREEDRDASEAREPEGHERPPEARPVGEAAAEGEGAAEGQAEGRDDGEERRQRRRPSRPDQVVREAEHVAVQGHDGDVDREQPPDVAVPEDGSEEFDGAPLRLRHELRLPDEELHDDDARGDAQAARGEDDRLRDGSLQGEESRAESADETTEGHEVEEGEELRAVLHVRVVVDHREGRGDLRRGPDAERGEVEGGEVREVARLQMERLHQETRERSHSASPAPAAPPGATYLRMVPRLSPRRIKGRDPETKVPILK